MIFVYFHIWNRLQRTFSISLCLFISRFLVLSFSFCLYISFYLSSNINSWKPVASLSNPSPPVSTAASHPISPFPHRHPTPTSPPSPPPATPSPSITTASTTGPPPLIPLPLRIAARWGKHNQSRNHHVNISWPLSTTSLMTSNIVKSLIMFARWLLSPISTGCVRSEVEGNRQI